MKTRCPFAKEDDPIYIAYHDHEWGVPIHDDQKHFELLILEGFQAGLSWALILKKREAFRAAFHNFDPQKVAAMSDKELAALEKKPAIPIAFQKLECNGYIIRNRRKIAGAKQNASIFLKIQKDYGSFDAYVWPFIGNKPKINHWKTAAEVPCTSMASDSLSLDLKKKGMTFVGPKIIYSYMQAAGLINDHLTTCFCHPNNL